MLSADRLAQSLGSNANLALPLRPRLAPDLVQLRDTRCSLILFGTAAPRQLSGRSVAAIAERLLPLLDGRRSVAEICARARGFSAATALDALYFLYSEGVLIEGSAAAPTPRSAFFDRYCTLRRNHANGQAAEAALRQSRIGLIGAATQFSAIADLLQQAGCAAPRELQDSDVDMSGLDLLLLAGPPPDAQPTAALARRLDALQLPLLCIDLQQLTLGPLLAPLSLACLVCAQAQLGITAPVTPDTRERDYAEALFCCRLISHLADLCDNALEQAQVQFDAATLSLRSTPIHRLVDCPHCGPQARQRSHAAAASTRHASLQQLVPFFHFNSQARASELARSSHLLSYSSGIRKSVAGAYKLYSRAEIQPAPAGEGTAARAVALVNTLLGWSAQLDDGLQQMRVRATPSAGNLASQSLYLICAGEGSLAAGVYYCHPDGRLRLLQAGDHVAAVAAACNAAPQSRAAVWLVATAALARLEAKYRDKAYRFAFHDAGALAEGLRALAQGEGLPLRLCANFFDDRLAALLRLGGVGEIVTFAACLDAPPIPFAAEAA